jgi:hypothetical protein
MYIRQLDEINWSGFNQSRYLNQNLVDPDMDISGVHEFGDYDDALAGLTIVEPTSVLETVRYLNGYAV